MRFYQHHITLIVIWILCILLVGISTCVDAQTDLPRSKSDIEQALPGVWIVESWEEMMDGDLIKGQLEINENLVGKLSGTAPGGSKIIEQFYIEILEDGTVKMDGTILKGYFIPDHFRLKLNAAGDQLAGRSIDDMGDRIDAVFRKYSEPVM